MKLIILEDTKGFRKEVVVSYFPPDYKIAEMPPISISRDFDPTVTQPPLHKILTFYPSGEPMVSKYAEVMLYKQIN